MKTHQHIHLQKTCKHISMGSRNTCKQQLVTWGPAHVAFPICGWAQDMELPPSCWGKVETSHRYLRVAMPGQPGEWPPGRLSLPRWSHSTVWCFLHMWNSASALLALRFCGAASATMREQCTDVSLHSQRRWDLTLPQEVARDRSVQTHRSHGIARAGSWT